MLQCSKSRIPDAELREVFGRPTPCARAGVPRAPRRAAAGA